ncbi:Putative KilA-N domain-containing protein 313L [Araneus ventricosus]|uniref:KilA-N domain-containing protein 313L n=1 Tax=Araneus ventricosus TaxID=182803 RepID=A0A4Y2LY18_ARAVE|nr:Putative KilA-N domain-containing protein 313L [Araneus ventricosus]
MQTSLIDVCYEQIKDHYWYGLFGNFRLIIDRNTGYFNATKLCHEGGKRLDNWLRNKESKKLIDYYSNKNDSSNVRNHFFEVKKGNKDEIYNKVLSGTYLPKQLILSLALWISLEFYDKVYTIIESYFVNEFNERYRSDIDKLYGKIQIIEYEMDRLRSENEKYRKFEEDKGLKTVDTKKLHTFTLIRKNSATSKRDIYVMRSQRLNYNNNIKRLKQKYPNLEIILELRYNLDSINLFDRIKEQLENIDVHYNGIKLLNGYTEEQFIQDIKEIANANVISMMEY